MDAKMIDQINEHIKARQFEFGAQLPISWKSTASNLKRAADKLYDCYHDARLREVQRAIDEVRSNQRISGTRELKGAELEDILDTRLITIYYLLVGYAIENLLKGILMIDHPEYFKPKAKMTDIRSHNLVKLCNRCTIPLQAEEAALLERLTIYIEWQGKYPIPLEGEKMWPIKQVDGSWKEAGETFRGRNTQEDVDNLYIKFWNELEQRSKSASTS